MVVEASIVGAGDDVSFVLGTGNSHGKLWGVDSSPSNVGLAIAVTTIAGIALVVTLVYTRSGSLKSPWSRRRRKQVLLPKQWKTLFTSDGKLSDGGAKFLKQARSAGVDPSIRAEVWPFLLGVYDVGSSKEERDRVRAHNRKKYENLQRRCRKILKHRDASFKRKEPDVANTMEDINHDQIHKHSDLASQEDMDKFVVKCETHSAEDTKLSDSETSNDLENATPSLSESSEDDEHDLNFHGQQSPSSTSQRVGSKTFKETDFVAWRRTMRVDAVRANGEWITYSPSQASVSEENARRQAESVRLKDYDHLEPCRIRHAARLVRILEAYALYDPEIGYCQGMSDLLTPIITTIEEDFEAFWCFVGFMKKARHNFRLDEKGIRRQLDMVSKIIKCKDNHLYKHLEELQAEDCFFVYRMVVVLLRRELNFEQTLNLWEVMWADQAAIRAGIGYSGWGRMRLGAPPTDDLLLYAIAAGVLQRRKTIIERYDCMEEIMKECNSMAGNLNVWKLLDDAHDLVVNFHEKI